MKYYAKLLQLLSQQNNKYMKASAFFINSDQLTHIVKFMTVTPV